MLISSMDFIALRTDKDRGGHLRESFYTHGQVNSDLLTDCAFIEGLVTKVQVRSFVIEKSLRCFSLATHNCQLICPQ